MLANDVLQLILNFDLERYFYQNNLEQLISSKKYVKTSISDPWHTAESAGGAAFSPECPDLTRLHALVTSRKILNVLEFGSGQSTKVIAHALKQNYLNFKDDVSQIRRATPFRITTLESERKYAKELEAWLKNSELETFVDIQIVEAKQTTYKDQICGCYKKIPSICPDLIYIDGPMPMSYLNGDTQYMSMNHSEITNITCDLLILEPVLLPGTIVIIDGMTNNARFNRRNLKRNWVCHENLADDYTVMVLDEQPLGVHHIRQLHFQNNTSSDKFFD